MKHAKRLKKPAEVRAQFEHNGISIAQWSRLHQVSHTLVSEILAGSSKRKCVRGQSHRVAVLLGLKDGAIVDDASVINAVPAR